MRVQTKGPSAKSAVTTDPTDAVATDAVATDGRSDRRATDERQMGGDGWTERALTTTGGGHHRTGQRERRIVSTGRRRLKETTDAGRPPPGGVEIVEVNLSRATAAKRTPTFQYHVAAAPLFPKLNQFALFCGIIIIEAKRLRLHKYARSLRIKRPTANRGTKGDIMSFNELFNTNEESSNRRSLQGTQELTSIASSIATRIFTAMSADVETYRDRIAETARDNAELDKLINEFAPFTEADGANFVELDERTVTNMLKSQQSKRSRSRGKAMTMDNYRTLLTAAVAENLIRSLCSLPKNAQGNRRAATVDYTPAELEALAADQEALRREIRNLQSKKSIYRGKAIYDETSDYWQSIIRAEAMLKDLRIDYVSTAPKAQVVDHTKDKLKELLNDIDPEHLKAADSKQLLADISKLIAADSNTSDTTDEQ